MTTPAALARLAAKRRESGRQSDQELGGSEHIGNDFAFASGTRRAHRRGEYRSFFTFDTSKDSLALILEQATAWLRDKGFDVPLDASGLYSAAERTLTIVHRPSSHCHDVRLLLTEMNTPRGRWDTELTLHLPERAAGWLALHVSNDQGHTAAPPRLARYLLDVVEARDASLRLSGSPTTVPSADVDDLLDAVCDPDRHGLVYVVGTAEAEADENRSYGTFRERAKQWARDVVGLGQIVVLDPLATAAFNAGIGSTHGVDPWAIRTYAPAPDPAWTADARRHRVFSAPRLLSAGDREVGRILGSSARAHAADRRLPRSVAAVDRDLRRAIDRLVLDGIFSSPTSATGSGANVGNAPRTALATRGARGDERVADAVDLEAVDDLAAVPKAATIIHLDVEETTRAADQGFDDAPTNRVDARVKAPESTLSLVATVLGLDEVTPESLQTYRRQLDDAVATASARAAHAADMADLARARLEEQQAKVEELEEDLQFHREYAVAADELRDEADLRARRAADEAQYLRKQLAAANQYDVAYGAVPSEAYSKYPDSFDDLLSRMRDEMHEKGVVFTGDASIARRLDAQDTSGRLVRSTWECLIVLVGYLEAKRAGIDVSGVHGYLTDSPTGYPMVSRNKFAPRESTSTMNRFGEERRFGVPEAVDADGSVLMEAHFKLGTLGLISPRMHFHDDTANGGQVYVGYIGPHLRTEQTN